MIRFAHTNIVSSDWKKLADFYIKTFGCKLVPPVRNQSGDWLDKGTGLRNAHIEGAHLRLPGHGENGPTLEIYQYQHMESQEFVSPNKRGFGHIAFEVSDVEMMLEKLIKNGGQTIGEIVKREVNGVGELTFVYARDSEGNSIELQQWN
ncbi:VOC family protein [Cryomorphaceae bacterium 1068]|nr:VOC family protein [Cryomorphaceae bacterium 1068]